LTFDPFGDFETRGYLRNIQGLKDQRSVGRLEHDAFRSALPGVLEHISSRRRFGYQDVLDVHRMLFASLYPWAGQDGARTAPDQLVTKGGLAFAYPARSRRESSTP